MGLTAFRFGQYVALMSTTLTLLGEGLGETVEGLSPQKLSGAHLLWEQDVQRYGPWEQAEDGSWMAGEWNETASVTICGPCSSSLDVARKFAEDGRLDEWDSVLALQQWAGRGQMRRDWSSPAGNLYAAWLLPKLPSEWDALLPLILGALCADVLADFGLELKIKWPNDLLVKEQKIGGILIEERGGVVIAGIGLNIVSAPPASAIREPWSPKAASIQDFVRCPTPLEVWSRLVDHAKYWYKTALYGNTPRDFLQTITQRMAWMDQDVLIHGNASELRATVIGLASDGGLVISRRGRSETIYSGSISPA